MLSRAEAQQSTRTTRSGRVVALPTAAVAPVANPRRRGPMPRGVVSLRRRQSLASEIALIGHALGTVEAGLAAAVDDLTAARDGVERALRGRASDVTLRARMQLVADAERGAAQQRSSLERLRARAEVVARCATRAGLSARVQGWSWLQR